MQLEVYPPDVPLSSGLDSQALSAAAQPV